VPAAMAVFPGDTTVRPLAELVGDVREFFRQLR
jgi:hypothetical protein